MWQETDFVNRYLESKIYFLPHLFFMGSVIGSLCDQSLRVS